VNNLIVLVTGNGTGCANKGLDDKSPNAICFYIEGVRAQAKAEEVITI
jgi:hypothetical protein